MKYLLLQRFYLSLTLGFFVLHLQAQQKASDVSARIDEYFATLTKSGRFNGNVVVSKDGRLLLQKSYNMAPAPAAMRVDQNSQFLTAGVSKLFVKFALARLADMGKLGLNDALNKFIPGFPKGDSITLQHLMDHRSGLPRELDGLGEAAELTLDSIVQLAKQAPFISQPGAEIHYSALGYQLLQFVIARQSEQGYDAFVDAEVFKRCGLAHTRLYQASSPALLASYLPQGAATSATVSPVLKGVSNNDYSTTAGDLFAFCNTINDGLTLRAETALKLFWKDSVLSQAGGREGYRAYAYKNLKTGITFVFLCNFSGLPFQDVCDDVIKIILGQPYRLRTKEMRVKKEEAPEKLQAYTGRYVMELDRNQYFEVTLQQGQLIFFDGVERIPLVPEGNDIFFEKAESADSFIFEQNEKTNKFDLLIVSNGVRFKALRVE